MRAIFIVIVLLFAAVLLGCFGKDSTAYSVLQVGQHLFEPEKDEESFGSREPKGAGLRWSGGVARHERRVTPLMKKKVAAKYGWKCACCGEKLTFDYHIDHILPLWKGGSNDEHNLQPLLPAHHLLKSSRENLV